MAGEENTNLNANTDSAQQAQDAQNLDDLTSLQQSNTPEQGEARADATADAQNAPQQDQPSLFNAERGANNNQDPLFGTPNDSPLDNNNVASNPGDLNPANIDPNQDFTGQNTDVATVTVQEGGQNFNVNPTIVGGRDGAPNAGIPPAAAPAAPAVPQEPTPTNADQVTPPTDVTPALLLDPVEPGDEPPAIVVLTPELSISKSGVVIDNGGLNGNDVDGDNSFLSGDALEEASLLLLAQQEEVAQAQAALDLLDPEDPDTADAYAAALETLTAAEAAVRSTESLIAGRVDSAGDQILYTLTVENTGLGNPVNNVIISDSMFAKLFEQGTTTVELLLTNPDGTIVPTEPLEILLNADTGKYYVSIDTLAVGQDAKITYIYTVEQEDIDSFGLSDNLDAETDVSGQIDNIAGAVGTDPFGTDPLGGDIVAPEVSYDVVIITTPELAITKTAVVTDQASAAVSDPLDNNSGGVGDNGAEGSIDSVNDTVRYTITVANTGNTTLTNVEVTDLMATGLTVSLNGIELETDSDGVLVIPEIAVGQSAVLTYTYVVTQTDIDTKGNTSEDEQSDLDNTAEVTSSDQTLTNDPTTLTVSADVAIINAPELAITKTAVVTDQASAAVSDPLDNNSGGVGDNGAEGSIDSVNDTVRYTITVANTGNTTLTNVEVTDLMATGLTVSLNGIELETDSDGVLVIPEIAVGQSAVLTYTYVVTQTDIDTKGNTSEDEQSDLDNTAEVTSSDQTLTNDPTTLTVSADVAIINAPELAITKTAVVTDQASAAVSDPLDNNSGGVGDNGAEGSIDSVNDTVRYTITVANTGNTTLTNVEVTDLMATGLTVSLNGIELETDSDGVLVIPEIAVGQSAVLTYTYVVTQTDIDTKGNTSEDEQSDLDNTAEVTSSDQTLTNDPTTLTVSADVAIINAPELAITKTAVVTDQASAAVSDPLDNNSGGVGDNGAEGSIDSVNDTVRYTITVANTGNTTLTNVEVTDLMATGLTVSLNGIELETDSDGVLVIPEIAVGQSAVLTYTYVVTQTDIDTKGNTSEDEQSDLDNTAEVTSSDQTLTNDPTTLTVSADVAIINAPELAITKTAVVTDQASAAVSDPLDNNSGGVGDNGAEGSIDSVNDTVRYTITVANTGNTTLTNVEVTDLMATGLTVSLNGIELETDSDGVLVIPEIAVGQSAVLTYTYVVTQTDIDTKGNTSEDEQSDLDNTAEVTSSDQTLTNDPTTLTVSADVAIINAPELAITKTAVVTDQASAAVSDPLDNNSGGVGDNGAEGSIDSVNDTVRYTITVANTGNTTLTNVEVTDLMATGLTVSLNGIELETDSDGVLVIPEIAVGQSAVLTYTYVVTQTDIDTKGNTSEDEQSDLDNTAEVTSSDQTLTNDPTTLTVSADVAIINAPELAITKTAVVTDQASAAVSDPLDNNSGGVGDNGAEGSIDSVNDTVRYTITVANTGNTTLTNVEVTDLMATGLTVSLNGIELETDSDGVLVIPEIAVGQSAVLTYTYVVTQTDIDTKGNTSEDEQSDLDNTAEVTSSDQTLTNDPTTLTVSADISIISTPDLLITKSAVIRDLGDDFDSDGSGSESSDSHDDENENNNSGDDDSSDDENNNSGDDDSSDDENNNSENEYRVENNNENDSESSSESDSSHHSVDSAGDLIEYTLTVQNTGNTTLTNVLVYDTMFNTEVSHITAVKVNGMTYTGTYGHDDNGYYIEIPQLQVGGTAHITYSYEVQIEDLNYTIETISSSDMSFSTSDRGMTYDVSIDGRDYVELSAYVNNNVVYDSNRTADLDESQNGKYDLGGTDAPIKMSSDTGAFTAGVAGNTVQGKYFGPSETKGYQEHMVATFNEAQAVKGGGFTITNVGDAEVALAVKFADGSIKIQSFIFSQNSPDSYSAGFTGTKASDNADLIKVTNSGDPISSAPGFQIQKVEANDGSEENDSDHNSGSNGSGATNVLWNISYTNSEDIVSIDIWAVGNPRNTSSEASFKVVDFGIDVPVYQASQIDNVAGADSDQTGLESVALSVAIDDHISADGSGEADVQGETEEGDSTISGEHSSRVDEEHESKSTGGKLVAHSSGGDETFFVACEEADGENGYGKFSVDMDGTWTYSMNSAYDEFEEGRNYTDSITVTTADGTTQLITVTIAGTNDAAVISGTSTASLTETNAVLTTTGTLTSTDVDGTANAFRALSSTAGDNGYGTFTMTSAGVWTYTTDTARNEFVSGTNYTDSVTVQAADGTNKTITVTIAGTNDAPVISAINTPVSYTENASAITLDSAVTVSDIDSADFNNGSLTVSFTANGTAADRLAIIAGSGTNPSDGSFSTNTSGSTTTLYYNPTGSASAFTVGTISSNGSNGSDLTINFSSSSVTPAVVEALIEKITYANTSDNPGAATRTVTFTLNDGDGGSTNIGTAAIDVNVTPVNDAAVISGTSTASLTETNAVLTTTGTLTSTDVDGTANAFRALSSTAGDNGYGTFTMTSAGVWTYTTDTARNEFVSGTNYTDSVTVQAADGTNKTITVTIAGTNDAPVISAINTPVSYTENASAITLDSAVTVSDIDSADFNNGSLTVSFTANGTAADRLAIIAGSGTNPSDGSFSTNTSGSTTTLYYNPTGSASAFTVGTISSNGSNGSDLTINFSSSSVTPAVVEALIEKITYANTSDNPGAATRTVTFTLNDGDGGSTNIGTAAIDVNVTPVNDAPTITSGSTGTVAENANINTVVYTATATDPESNTLSYSVTGTDAARFNINSSTGEVTLKASADFETKSSYSINVVATDNGTGLLTDSKAVTINVTNVNEAPVISAINTPVSYTENASAITLDSAVTVSDIDSADFNNGSLTVSFTANGTAADRLAIIAGSGTNPSDGSFSTNTSGSTTTLYYNPTGSASAFTVGTISSNGSNGSDLTINFSSSSVTPAVVEALIEKITYANTSDNPGAATRTVTFTLNDGDGGSTNIGTAAIDVNVTPVNDAPTITSGSTGTVAENANINTVVYTATATDPESNTLSYSVTGTDAARFNINSSTGEVTLKASADFETKSSYSINVVATDNGTGLLTDSKAVTINVTNVNEAPTATITSATYSATEQTNLTIHGTGLSVADVDSSSLTVILSVGEGIITATAGNSGVASLSGSGTSAVTITGTAAQINNLLSGTDVGSGSAGTLVYNNGSNSPSASTLLTLSVNDGFNSAVVDTATINITPVNDAPTITSGSTGTVAENANINTVVYTATATDPESNTLSYSVTGTDAARFNINSSTGEVTLKASADFETKSSYSINVVATDNGTGLLTDSKAVTINVTNVNEAPTAVITPTTYSATEQVDRTLHGTGLSVADVDSSSLTVILSVGEGIITATAGNSGVASLSGSGTSAVTVTGTATQINNLLAGTDTGTGSGGTLVYNANSNSPSASTLLTLSVNDGFNSAVVDTATINITPVNDAPTLTSISTADVKRNAGINISFNALLGKSDAQDDGSVAGFVVKSVGTGSSLLINGQAFSSTNNVIDATHSAVWQSPNNTSTGTTAFTVVALDNLGLESSSNVAVKVNVASSNSTTYAPIALDLDGNGINYLSTSAGVTHDFTNTGVNEATAWVGSGDGLLALQREDGTLNIVFSTQAGETDLQGLAKVYDSNKDNVFDSEDVDFAKFGAWQDVDSDGKVDAGEFKTLADRGIASLSLTSDGQVSLAANGDVIIHGETTFTTTDGATHIAQDVSFATNGDFYLADFSALLSGADSVHSKISIDQDGATDSHSSLFVELGGQTYEIATMKGEELGGKDILSHFAGADGAKALDGSAWTEVVDITSLHGGPASVTAEGGALTNSFDNNGGDWTVVVKSGTATVDTANNQITFSSDHADNAVTITTADGTSHDIHNVDKIQWHG